MKKRITFFIIMVAILFTSGCSDKFKGMIEDVDAGVGGVSYDKMSNEMKVTSTSNTRYKEESVQYTDQALPNEDETKKTQERMVIYNAHLNVEVKDIKDTKNQLENLVSEMNGYIVSSSERNEGENKKYGNLKIRIPQEHFNSFIKKIEEISIEVLDRSVNGQDVTEEYVDLKSRLKSKRLVEERLITFMGQATRTEDLLRISNELARVQEEIESVVGKMKYLEDQTDLSTVNVIIQENKLIIPDIQKDDLNTWERTKQQFNESVNNVLLFASGTVVFLVGNSPILLFFVIIISSTVFIIKKKRKNKSKKENEIINK